MARNWLKHKKWELTGLIGSVVLLAAVVGGIGWTLSLTASQNDTHSASLPPLESLAPAPVVELGNEADGEFERQHFRRFDGTMLRTVISYRNKSTGEVTYRPDGTFERFIIVSSKDEQLRDSTYDPTGTFVVDGWAKRLDGTLEWKTETLDTGAIVTTIFWQNGTTPFSRRVRDFQAATIETTYWHDSGIIWSRQLAHLSSPDKPYEEDVFNEILGTLERSVRPAPEGGVDVTYYRNGGHRYFVRHHRIHANQYMSQMVLDATTVYAEDGVTVDMEVSWYSELNPSSIEVFHRDGTRVVNKYDFYRASLERIVYAADDSIISTTEKGADPTLFQKLSYKMWTEMPPPPVDPQPFWDKAETS